MFAVRAFSAAAGANSGITPVTSISRFDTLLLPGTGANNATNNTFVDSSSNNFTVTRSGNTTQGTFTPYSDAAGYWSNYFDGTGDYLSVADATAFDLPNDFTIEMWIYPVSTAGAIISIGNYQAGNNGLSLYFNSNKLRLYVNASDVLLGASNLVANTWTHVALVRSGSGSNNLKLYLNGVQDAQATNTTSYTGVAANGVSIAADYGGTFSTFFTGYTSNVRIVKDTAVYTSNFTPSTTPLTAVSGTSLLTSNNNRFMDSSSNNFTVTRVGDTRVQSFGPFTPARTYSTGVVGGSMYFDGTGDLLSVADNAALNFGTGAFTVEAWIYPTSISAAALKTIVGKWNNGDNWLLVLNNTNNVRFYYNGGAGASIDSTATVVANQWTHVAVSRDASNNLRIYVNGVNSASTTSTFNSSTISPVTVGSYLSGANFTGYISNVRIVKGSAVYSGTTSFTPPTAPLTAVSGTSLLLSGTNAAIYDASMSTVLETVGDAKVSTTVSAGGSMYFDGTGDYLTTPAGPNVQYGTGDFTIEWWQYSSNVSGAAQRGVFQTSTTAGGLSTSYTTGIMFVQGSNGASAITGACAANIMGTYVGTASSVLIQNTWQHVAITRSNGTCRVFVGGTQVASATVATAINSNNLVIGGYYNASYLYVGYLQDFRMTKGFARYTSNFTPPTRST
jgi:hypothetical protein